MFYRWWDGQRAFQIISLIKSKIADSVHRITEVDCFKIPTFIESFILNGFYRVVNGQFFQAAIVQRV